jgi:tetratricopeptide (TPR) repeat protein
MSVKKIIYILAILCFLILTGTAATAQSHGKQAKGKKEVKGKVGKTGNSSMLIDAKRMAITGNENDAEDLLRKYTEKYPGDPNGHFELARLLADRKNVEEAISQLEEAVDIDPDNTWYRFFLSELYQYAGKYSDAIKIYDRLIQEDRDNLDNYYQLASLYLSAGKYNDAIRIYNQIESKIGVTEEISLQKEKIHLLQKDFQDAEDEMKKLIAAFPSETRYMAILAELYMSVNQQDKAYQIYQKILTTDPEDPYIHMTLADFYRKQGNKEKAFGELKIGFANPALDIDTKVAILLSFYNINQVYDDLKDEAEELSRILIATHPNNPKGYSIAGDLYVQDKKYPEARDVFIKAVALDSSKYIIWEEILRLDMVLEQYDHLLGYAKTATELFPDQPMLYVMTGIAEFQLNHYLKALDQYNRALKLVVTDNDLLAQVYMHLGDTYHALNNPEESDKAYEKSLQIRDNNAYVLNNYAYYLSIRNKDLEKAEQMAKKALELEPANSSFQDTYGWVMYKTGKYDEAKKWIGKALEDTQGVSAEVLEHYGDTLYRLGNAEGAMDYWRKARAKGEGSELLEKKIADKKLIE